MTQSVLIYCNGDAVFARWLGGPDCKVECPCGAVLSLVDEGEFDRRVHSFEPTAKVLAFPGDPRD